MQYEKTGPNIRKQETFAYLFWQERQVFDLLFPYVSATMVAKNG